MSHVRSFDHVGITVSDLEAAAAFFTALGLEIEGRSFVEGEFIDTVIGIPNSRTEILMLLTPDGGTKVELSSFRATGHGGPTGRPGQRDRPAERRVRGR